MWTWDLDVESIQSWSAFRNDSVRIRLLLLSISFVVMKPIQQRSIIDDPITWLCFYMEFAHLSIFAGFDNTYATTTDGRGSPIPRTGSPERSSSPVVLARSRSCSPVRITATDVDPDAVKVALRDFVQQLISAERERVSWIWQINNRLQWTTNRIKTNNRLQWEF